MHLDEILFISLFCLLCKSIGIPWKRWCFEKLFSLTMKISLTKQAASMHNTHSLGKAWPYGILSPSCSPTSSWQHLYFIYPTFGSVAVNYLIMDATLIEHQLFQEKDVARKSVEGQKSNFWAIWSWANCRANFTGFIINH